MSVEAQSCVPGCDKQGVLWPGHMDAAAQKVRQDSRAGTGRHISLDAITQLPMEPLELYVSDISISSCWVAL